MSESTDTGLTIVLIVILFWNFADQGGDKDLYDVIYERLARGD